MAENSLTSSACDGEAVGLTSRVSQGCGPRMGSSSNVIFDSARIPAKLSARERRMVAMAGP